MSDELVIQSENDELLRNRFHIPVEILFKQFENHLQIENNLRVFFSAKFGSGKTYFLNEFFEANKEKYIVIKLYPVSYSTASNRDIFELIKFDILFHILSNYSHTVEKSPEIKELLKIQFFISEFINQRKASLLTDVFSIFNEVAVVDPVTKLGTTKILSVLSEAYKEYEKFKKNTFKNDTLDSNDFLNRILDEHPEYSFEDPISRIISESIKKLQTETENQKEVILLIDDMDRLDPDHLFRILNVFGNHFVESNISKFYRNENKFGFDKIITVGDINNIQSIFAHRYGENADFRGYFSKYYSKKEYSFSNINTIDLDNVKRLLPKLRIPKSDIDLSWLESKLNEDKELIFLHIINAFLKKPKDYPFRDVYSYIDGREINVQIPLEYQETYPDLSKHYYYLAHYFELLFRGNIELFKSFSTEEIPVCLGEITKDTNSLSKILLSSLTVELFKKHDNVFDELIKLSSLENDSKFSYMISEDHRFISRNIILKMSSNGNNKLYFSFNYISPMDLERINVWSLITKIVKGIN